MLKRLEKIMNDRKITRYRLSKMCNINISTVEAFWRVGITNIKLTTFTKLCSGLDVSVEFMLCGNQTQTSKEKEVIKKYRTVGEAQKITVDTILGIVD